MLESQACLIGNRRALAASSQKRDVLRQFLELAEARLRVRNFRIITSNIQGESEEAVARHVLGQVETAGTEGPTVSRVYPKTPPADGRGWYAVNLIVESRRLLSAVDHLRRAGASGITVVRPDYVFEQSSTAYLALLRELGEEGVTRSRGGILTATQ